MAKFKVNGNPQGQYYFKKEVREELGRKLELICSVKTAVIYPVGTRLETILESLAIIIKDLEHRLQIQKKQQNKPIEFKAQEKKK